MTMTAHAALPSPPDPAEYHDPLHPTYGFHTTEWHETPRPPYGQDWFSDEERCRREANAHAYRQHGTTQNWLRYLTLGYFVYDDCSKFDALWMKYSSDPIICHRMVWYNFLYHVDRNLDISKHLHAWATDVSQPYLQRHSPQHLAINTMEHSWTDHIRGDHDVMDIESTQWTMVGPRRTSARSKSPPSVSRNLPSNRPSINDILDHKDNSHTIGKTKPIDTNPNHEYPNPNSPNKASYGGHSTPDNWNSRHNTPNNQSKTQEEDSTGKQSALQPYLNVPTNDGTYRVTFRWTPPGDFQTYGEHSSAWLAEVHTLMTDLFTDEDCSFYRWESIDLTLSHVISELSPGELREFLSPKVTFIESTTQIIFGARICFAANTPGQWKNKERTKMALKDNQVTLKISNSSTLSGKMVTAGYILLKAARTTHRTRFLQSLRMQLPPETPFFDILQFQRTPTEQKINHLVVQCGENHVSPLSKALSEVMTGHNSSLYLSRLALAKLSSDQISSYFEMQDKYSKSLKSLPLFPTLTNLDKPRKEYFADGSVVERSARDWAASIFKGQSDMSARCEVVNGGFDQKAYLLVPTQQFSVAQEHLRHYRLRINPIGRREARFRDSLPGLPSVIHIDTSTQQNLDFLARLSASEVWERAPPGVRQATQKPNVEDNRIRQDNDTFLPPAMSQPSLKVGNTKRKQALSLSSLGKGDARQNQSHSSDNGHDDQTTSTKSASQSMVTPSVLSNTTSRKLQELESLFRNQQTAIETNATLSKQMDTSLQQTITTLQDNSDKLLLTMERQQDTHVQLVELSTRVSRMTDVMDRMASQIEALTTLTMSNQTAQILRDQGGDGTRRRPITEMSDQEVKPVDGRSGIAAVQLDLTQGLVKHSHISEPNSAQDQVPSPTKKKSRKLRLEPSSLTLHSDLEEMSLGTDDGENVHIMPRMEFQSQQAAPHSEPAHTDMLSLEESDNSKNSKVPVEDRLTEQISIHLQRAHSQQLIGGSLLDDSLDDFSTTPDALPNLDTQYNSNSDPEGGEFS
jgi:hypothetical protein